MNDAIEKLLQRARNCQLLAQTALTENGRDTLNAMAVDYDLRAAQLKKKSSRQTLNEVPRAKSLAN